MGTGSVKQVRAARVDVRGTEAWRPLLVYFVVACGVLCSGAPYFSQICCGGEAVSQQDAAGSDLAPLPPVQATLDKKQVELGRLLFFDARLSGDATVSCASCHQPQQAWSDGEPLSSGYPGSLGFRNTPSLLNAAQRKYAYWDGRLPMSDLPTIVRDHISEAHFMQADGRLVIERLKQVSEYRDRFQDAFDGEPSYGRILGSVSSFVQSLRSGDTPFDRYLRGQDDSLSESAVRGLAVFRGVGQCTTCHHGSMLSDGGFHDIGVPANPEVISDPLRHITFRRFFRTLGVSEYEHLRRDPGLYCVTKEDSDRGRFRTPSLREVSRTAPYMHNGMLQTLEQVVAFYDQGGGESPGKDARLKPLGLSLQQRTDLVEFLKSLASTPTEFQIPKLPEYTPVKLPTTRAGRAVADRKVETLREVPSLAALPLLPPVPGDNPITDAKIELGKLLFFDERLSGDGGTSCATCHEPVLGWGDGNTLSMGYDGTEHWRNSQTLVNTGYLGKLFWASESPSLEAQAKSALTGNLAGNGDPAMLEERVKQVPEYVRMFKEAYGVSRPTFPLMIKAIATFERAALNSVDSPFDRYMRGDKAAMSVEAVRGMQLFEGKARCNQCHNGALLTDEGLHNLGVPTSPLFERSPMHQISLRYQFHIRGVPEKVYRSANRDLGFYYTTKLRQHLGKFRTPPLRYLEYTDPYMHNGVFASLEEVIEFYDQGGGTDAMKSPLLKPLGLTDDEKADLLEFLNALSGSEIDMDEPDLPPYVASELKQRELKQRELEQRELEQREGDSPK